MYPDVFAKYIKIQECQGIDPAMSFRIVFRDPMRDSTLRSEAREQISVDELRFLAAQWQTSCRKLVLLAICHHH